MKKWFSVSVIGSLASIVSILVVLIEAFFFSYKVYNSKNDEGINVETDLMILFIATIITNFGLLVYLMKLTTDIEILKSEEIKNENIVIKDKDKLQNIIISKDKGIKKLETVVKSYSQINHNINHSLRNTLIPILDVFLFRLC